VDAHHTFLPASTEKTRTRKQHASIAVTRHTNQRHCLHNQPISHAPATPVTQTQPNNASIANCQLSHDTIATISHHENEQNTKIRKKKSKVRSKKQ
jgi:hypothetical protein